MADGGLNISRWRYRHAALAVIVLVVVVLASCLAVRSGAVGDAAAPGPAAPVGAVEAKEAAEGVETARVVIAGRAFELELALTPEQRYQGLSDRAWIPPDGGMLFVFPDAAHRTFVMRRCLVPIDLIYLDAQGEVMSMDRMAVEPYNRPELFLTRYRSPGPAQYAIELAGGMLNELDLAAGDAVDLPDDLKQRAR